MSNITITTSSSDVLKEIEDDTKNVPLGMSDFQNRFLSTIQETPMRKKRHVLLQMRVKISALKENELLRDRSLIDIDEINYKLNKENDPFAKRRLEVDLREKMIHLQDSEKLVEDAIQELNGFYSIYKELPMFTREEFEKEEMDYYTKRFLNEAKAHIQEHGSIDFGTIQSLRYLGYDSVAIQTELKSQLVSQTQGFLDYVNKKEDKGVTSA